MKQKGEGNLLSEVKLTYISKYIEGSEVLDIGAGKGQYSKWISQNCKFNKIVAIDHEMVTNPEGFQFLYADLENPLAFNNESFSTILAFDIIEHINNVDILINEMYRVCKKNGMLIGSVPHDDDKFLPAYNLTFYHRSDLTHKRYYLPQALQKALENVGFKVICIDKQGGVSPHVISEFFPKPMQFLVKKTIGLLRRIGIINGSAVASDLFFVAKKI